MTQDTKGNVTEDIQGQELWNEIVHTILRIGIIRALNESAGDFLGPPRSTDKTTLIIKESKDALKQS